MFEGVPFECGDVVEVFTQWQEVVVYRSFMKVGPWNSQPDLCTRWVIQKPLIRLGPFAAMKANVVPQGRATEISLVLRRASPVKVQSRINPEMVYGASKDAASPTCNEISSAHARISTQTHGCKARTLQSEIRQTRLTWR